MSARSGPVPLVGNDAIPDQMVQPHRWCHEPRQVRNTFVGRGQQGLTFPQFPLPYSALSKMYFALIGDHSVPTLRTGGRRTRIRTSVFELRRSASLLSLNTGRPAEVAPVAGPRQDVSSVFLQ